MSGKVTLSEFVEGRPYLQTLNEWRPKCEYCYEPGLILLSKRSSYYRVFCADHYNSFIKTPKIRKDVRSVYVLRGVTIRELDPVFHKIGAKNWGRTIPPNVIEFFRNKDEITGRDYNSG